MVLNGQIENNRILNFGLIVAVLFVFAIANWPVLVNMEGHWSSGDNSYCYLIIPLFLYLCWEKKDTFGFDRFEWNPVGIVPVILFALLMVAGELGSVETLQYFGIWGCIVGILFVLYGIRIRHLAFPILILLFIVPMPPFINQMLTFNMKLAASTLSVFMMRAADMTVYQTGNIIDIGMTQLQVVDACSGLRYFVPLILMGLLFGYFYNKKFWKKALLLAIVPPLSILVNGLRIFATGMLHMWGYPELAEDFFHDFSGWLVFMIAGAILLGVSVILKRIDPHEENSHTVRKTDSKNTSMYKQFTLAIILGFIFVGTGWAIQTLPSSRNLPDRSSFATFPMTLGEWKATRNYLSDKILDSLWADDYVSAVYRKDGSLNTIQILIPFYEYQGTRHTAHAPQSCMLGGGWNLIKSEDRAVGLGGGNKVNIRATIWKQGENRVFGAYFFYQRGRVIASPWANKFYLMWDAFTRQRTDGALVRIEMVMEPGQTDEDVYLILEDFMGSLWGVLSDYVPT